MLCFVHCYGNLTYYRTTLMDLLIYSPTRADLIFYHWWAISLCAKQRQYSFRNESASHHCPICQLLCVWFCHDTSLLFDYHPKQSDSSFLKSHLHWIYLLAILNMPVKLRKDLTETGYSGELCHRGEATWALQTGLPSEGLGNWKCNAYLTSIPTWTCCDEYFS